MGEGVGGHAPICQVDSDPRPSMHPELVTWNRSPTHQAQLDLRGPHPSAACLVGRALGEKFPQCLWLLPFQAAGNLSLGTVNSPVL